MKLLICIPTALRLPSCHKAWDQYQLMWQILLIQTNCLWWDTPIKGSLGVNGEPATVLRGLIWNIRFYVNNDVSICFAFHYVSFFVLCGVFCKGVLCCLAPNPLCLLWDLRLRKKLRNVRNKTDRPGNQPWAPFPVLSPLPALLYSALPRATWVGHVVAACLSEAKNSHVPLSLCNRVATWQPTTLDVKTYPKRTLRSSKLHFRWNA